MFQTGLRAAAQRLPFLPMRAGLGSDVLVHNPDIRTVTSPYDDGEELVAVPALHLDVALVHLNRADQHGNATYLGPDPYFDDLFCMAADRAYVSVRAGRRHRRAHRRHPRPAAAAEPDDGRRRRRGARTARTSPPARPTTSATRPSCATTRRPPPTPRPGRRSRQRFLAGDEAAYQARGRAPSTPSGRRAHERTPREPRSAPRPIADGFADDGEIFGSPMGLLPTLGARLCKLTSNPDLLLSDGEALFLGGVPPLGETRRRGRGLDPVPPGLRRRRLRQAARDDGRHPDRPARQPEHLRSSATSTGPKRQLLGARGAPGNTVNNRTSLLGAQAQPAGLRRAGRHGLRRRSGPGRGGRPGGDALQRHPPGRDEPRRARRRRRPTARCGCARCTRASPSTRCARPAAARSTSTATYPRRGTPTPEELVLIREVLDPKALRDREVPPVTTVRP